MSVSKRNNSWVVRYRDNQGRHRSKAHRTKQQAEQFERKMKDALIEGTWSNPDLGKLTLAEVNELFMKSKINLKSHSKVSLESLWRCHIEPRFGKVKISSITFNDIYDWVLTSATRRNNPVSSERITKAQVQLAQLLDFAVDHGYLSKNPARKSNGQVAKIALPKRDITNPKIALTIDELKRLADASGSYRTLILFTGTLGLRWAEVIGLQVRDIDFVNKRIQVVRNLNEIHGYFEESTTKTSRIRFISLPDFLIPLLEAECLGKNASDLVFTTPSGTPLRNSNFKRSVLKPAISQAKVPSITFHELRHTAASNAISMGGKIEEVSNMLGHSDKSLTLKVYSHMFSLDERNLSKKLNENFLNQSDT